MSDDVNASRSVFESARPRLSGLLERYAPQWIAHPESQRECREDLRRARSDGVRVWPLGAGTHVVLPRGPMPTYAILDTTGLHRVDTIDPRSLLVRVEAGCTVGALEAALGEQDLTLKHLGQLPESATIGGLLSRRCTWPAPFGFPDVRAACVGLTVQLDGERTYTYASAPRKATGPDLRALFLGGQGCAGVLTRVCLAVARQPEGGGEITYEMPNMDVAVQVARRILSNGVRPWRLEVRAYPGGAKLLVLLGGEPRLVDKWCVTVAQVVEEVGGSSSERSEWELRGVSGEDVYLAGVWEVVLAGVKIAVARGYRANIYGATPWGAHVHFLGVSVGGELGRELMGMSWERVESPEYALSQAETPGVVRRLGVALDTSSLWYGGALRGLHSVATEVLP